MHALAAAEAKSFSCSQHVLGLSTAFFTLQNKNLYGVVIIPVLVSTAYLYNKQWYSQVNTRVIRKNSSGPVLLSVIPHVLHSDQVLHVCTCACVHAPL